MHRQHINRILARIAQVEATMRPDGGKQALHPPRLRHSFGDRHRSKSGSDTETAAALGHTSLRYVGRYVRKTEEERDALIEVSAAGRSAVAVLESRKEDLRAGHGTLMAHQDSGKKKSNNSK